MSESFANAPRTLAEERADRSHDPADWAPRDLLVQLLRRIDAGELEVSRLIVVYQEQDGPHRYKCCSRRAGVLTVTEEVGMLETAKHDLLQDSLHG